MSSILITIHFLLLQTFNLFLRYNEVWKTKDESANLKQLHYEDMIYSEKYSEVEMELRRIVDEMMRHELNLLQVCCFLNHFHL